MRHLSGGSNLSPMPSSGKSLFGGWKAIPTARSPDSLTAPSARSSENSNGSAANGRPATTKNLHRKIEVIMVRQSQIIGMGKAAFSATGAAIRLVRRAISALGVWMLPLIVGVLVAAALTGGLSLHRGAGTTPDQTTALGERPFMN